MERRLAAILAADVVGYSRQMGADEQGTLAALKAHRRELIDPKAAQYHGRTVKLMGDGALMEFPSVVDAVAFAVEVQHHLQERNADLPEERRIRFRIGINIGDVVVEDDDIYGDGVNVAARLESLAEPGGICLARSAYNQVRGKLDLNVEHLGEKEVKNIAEPVSVYRLLLDDKAAALVTPIRRPDAKRTRRWRPAMAAGFALLVLAIGGGLSWTLWTPAGREASVESLPQPPSDKPSIAVMPFDSLSGEGEQDYFADGMTEDLITDLSKISGLFVIARNSSFHYKDKSVDIRQVADELNVRYVLEGSIRRAGDHVRINAQLIDGETGGHVWAERYDELEDDVFALQDRVVREIAEALRVRLTAVDQDRLDHQPRPVNLAAYEWLLKGRQQLAEQSDRKAAKAKEYFEKAIEADPGYARAYTNLGLYYWNEWHLWGRDKEKNLEKAREIGHKAVELDPQSAAAAALLAVAYQYQGDHAEADKWADRAIALRPTQAETLGNLGGYLRHANRYGEAVDVLAKAIRLDPLHPPHWQSWLGHALYMDDRPDKALAVLKDAVAREPDYIANHVYLTAVFVEQGKLEEARAEARRILELNENFTVSAYERYIASNTKDPSREQRTAAALRRAGVPD